MRKIRGGSEKKSFTRVLSLKMYPERDLIDLHPAVSTTCTRSRSLRNQPVKGRKGEIFKHPDILNLPVEELCTELLALNANQNRCRTFSQCHVVNNYTGLSLEEVKHAWENVKVENAKIENVKIENVKIENAKIENVKIENAKI